MHYLDESHIFLFLVQLLVLLGVARTLSALCEEVRIPAITGEIVAGIMLGPTLLGRVAPGAHLWLFPHEAVQSTMLETVSWLGVFFLLLGSGFHVDVAAAVKQGRAALLVGVVGVVVPVLIGLPIFAALGEQYWGADATQLSFSLFLAVAASITAISVVARALGDLGLSRATQGSLALSACAINDLFGWLLFTVVVSIATATSLDILGVTWTALGVIAFVAVCITVGSKIVGVAARWVQRTSLSQPAALMTLLVTVGLLAGAITQWLGIHAILGFFLAGTMAASADGVSEQTRDSLSATLHAVFVPIFFATLGIKIDFVAGLELPITALFTVVAVGGKFVGAWLGARLSRISKRDALLMGIVFIPGGAMEIVVGTLALELRLITETVFVAIVFAALVSSIIVGPLIAWRARKLGLPLRDRKQAAPSSDLESPDEDATE